MSATAATNPVLEDDVRALLGPDGPIAAALGPDYEPRPGQLAMAEAVARALVGDEVALIEAGTGIGKSFAYLAPAALFALGNGEKVVVATATIHLQEQLLGKDVPTLREALRRRSPGDGASGAGAAKELQAVVVKGRSNYVSLRRAEEAGALGLEAFASGEEHREVQRLAAWARTTRTGDRAELGREPDSEAWEYVESQGDNCLGQRCPRHAACHFFAARRSAGKAHIVIANHSLLLADLAIKLSSSGAAGVLPLATRVVIDEAHHLEHTAGEQFGSSLSAWSVSRALARLQRRRDHARGLLPMLVRRLLDAGPEVTPLARRVEEELRPLRDRLADEVDEAFELAGLRIRAALPEGERSAAEARLRLGPEAAPLLAPLAELGPTLTLFAARLLACTDEARSRLAEHPARGSLEPLLRELDAAGSRIERMARELAQLLVPGPELVRWAEVHRRRGRDRLSLRAVPIDVGPILQRALFAPARSVVLSSATLTVGGSFEFLLRNLGFPPAPGEARLRTARVASPFDYGRQAILAVPSDIPLPDSPGFEEALCEAVSRCVLASRGRAFVLFTSHAALIRAHQRLAPELLAAGLLPLRQGEEGRGELLRRFRAADGAVLFGTDSFWEGVDVAGEGLVLVIIARLPFRVPSEPIQAARSEACAARGGDPFRELQLPQAVLKLTQGFGRLIRTRTDRGAVVVLDRRLTSRWYGRHFIESLPPVRVEAPPLEELVGTIARYF